MAKKIKTNVMRLLQAAKIPYEVKEYDVDENDLSGLHVAKQLGQPVEKVFKTLVLRGEKNGYFVCCVPVAEEVDLKKAAKVMQEKKVDMIPMKDLLTVTGYIRGGCSPIGMKKKFPTLIHKSAEGFEQIAVSAGVRGAQIILKPAQLCEYVDGSFVDLI